jgi:predicted nucleotidyltransferase
MTAQKVDLPLDEISEICRNYRVRELSVFGSYSNDNLKLTTWEQPAGRC